jgi:WD40 repeat protein
VTFDGTETLVATASEDGTARAWTVSTCRPLGPTLGTVDRDPLNTVAFSPDGSRLVTGDASGRARVWRIHDGRLLATLAGHAGGVVAVAPFRLSEGLIVVTAGADGVGRLWGPESGQTRLLVGHTDKLTAVAVSRDDRLVATASADGTARVWTRAGEEVAVLRGHKGLVRSVVFDRSGNRLVTASEDGTVRVWQLPPRQLLLSASPQTHALRAVASNTTVAVTGDESGAVRLWDAHTGDALATLAHFPSAVVRLAFSGDGTRLLAASDEGAARLWKLRNREATPVATLQGPRDTLLDAALSSNGRLAVTAGTGMAQLWSIDRRGRASAPKPLPDNAGLVGTVAIGSPSNPLIATGDDGGFVRIWNRKTLRASTLEHFKSRIVRVGFSGSGRRLFAVSADGAAGEWDVESHKLIGVTRDVGDNVDAAAFSRDGKLAVALRSNPTVRIVRLDDGAEVATLVGDGRAVVDIDFSPDSSRVVTASRDGTARVGLAAGGEQQGLSFATRRSLTGVRFSPDGGAILAASEDGAAYLFPCWLCGSIDDLITLARSRGKDG